MLLFEFIAASKQKKDGPKPSFLFPIIIYCQSFDVDFSALEADFPICGGEQGVVPSHTDIMAREELCAALPDYYRTGLYRLAAVQFHTSILRIAIPAISRRALSLFMCHSKLPFLYQNY
jgi:hypothetical protein